MLSKILDYGFNLNGLPIDRSGQNNHGQAISIIPSIDSNGNKGAGFLAPNSRITIPGSNSWKELNAARIDIKVRLNQLDHRVNLVEIENSLALFIRADGVVTFAQYVPIEFDPLAPVPTPPSGSDISSTITAFPSPTPAGSPDPFSTLVAPPPQFKWIGVNTDKEFSPTDIRHTVPVNQYVNISVVHDGIASMQIFINGELSGARYDLEFPVLPLAAGNQVFVGAWPSDNRYTLFGVIDYLRVWKQTPNFRIKQFFCRPMSDEAFSCWQKIIRQLTSNLLDEDKALTYIELALCMDRIEIELYRKLIQKDDSNIKKLEAFSKKYLEIWCLNDLGSEQSEAFLKSYIEWIQENTDGFFDEYFLEMNRCLMKARDLFYCEDLQAFKSCDPNWNEFLLQINNQLPNPFCISKPVDCKDENKDHGTYKKRKK